MDHDKGYIMARCKYGQGNLKLNLTERGLDFSFDCPETVKGEELLQHVKRGEIDSCSFAFTLPDDGEMWYKQDNMLCREITKFERLYDVACVFYPAYEQTSCSARSIELAKEAIEKLNDSDMNKENENIEVRDAEETAQELQNDAETVNE